MKNKRAQALVEFALILPILIIIIFSIIDFGNIYLTKGDLESKLAIATDILKSNADDLNLLQSKINNSINKDNEINIKLEFDDTNEYLKIILEKDVKTITPGLNLIIGYPYKASVERVMKYVKQ